MNKEKSKNTNNTRCSQAVTHPSTIRALRCLTSVIGREPVIRVFRIRKKHLKIVPSSSSVIGREPVFSSWYGRWRGIEEN
ncbi:hypothetical protein J437_LFUL014845 [Ladona fulva]|uniref:Uncharacterized protein n=1 Tax=Ladona fulva TaxID=123851 RepID=A0A8K0P349_LADFU|nr:hypothetical protein J437_LFUL014845 [Ladona fulva]